MWRPCFVEQIFYSLIFKKYIILLQVKFAVSMQLEIAPQHHLFIIGRSGMNIKQIMQRTGASIHFPDPNTSAPQRKGTIYITGNIESVFQARQHLIVSTKGFKTHFSWKLFYGYSFISVKKKCVCCSMCLLHHIR